MRPLRAFSLSFVAGLFAFFSGYALLCHLVVAEPDVQLEPLNIAMATA